jgi:hypothetical protein
LDKACAKAINWATSAACAKAVNWATSSGGGASGGSGATNTRRSGDHTSISSARSWTEGCFFLIVAVLFLCEASPLLLQLLLLLLLLASSSGCACECRSRR